MLLAVDIGGTKTALLVAKDDSAGEEPVATATFATPCEAPPADFVAMLRRETDAMLVKAGASAEDIEGVGCAAPGQVDDAGRVLFAGNLRGWKDVPLRDLLEGSWKVPAYVEQDANAGALGEMERGVARGVRDFVFVALGTGVGAGIVIGGRLLRGARNAAGELGDLLPGRSALGPGPFDTRNLTAHVGSRAIRARAEALTGREYGAAEAVADAEHDPRLAPLAEEVADHVALLIVTLTAVLDPALIVLGGGTASEALLTRVQPRVSTNAWTPPRLRLAELGEDAQLHGVLTGARVRLAVARAGER